MAVAMDTWTGGRQRGLSEDDRLILGRLASGETNQEIADAIGLSLSAVKWHVTRIFDRLGAKNRAEAAAMAVGHNIGRTG